MIWKLQLTLTQQYMNSSLMIRYLIKIYGQIRLNIPYTIEISQILSGMDPKNFILDLEVPMV